MIRKAPLDRREWAVIHLPAKDDGAHEPVRCWYVETALEVEAQKERDEPGEWTILNLRTGKPYRKPRRRRQRA